MQSDLDPKWGEWSPLHDPNILAHFQARTTDVLITTAPKAGTTWMQQILYQLKSGGDTSFRSIDDVVPWLELPRRGIHWQVLLARYEQLDNPRVFKTHCTYRQTPQQTPGVEHANIILSSRDPRDCCVSFYHHVMSMTDKALQHVGIPRPQNFDEYFEQWMSFGAWFRNVRGWWPHIGDRNVLWLRYEDMVNDLASCIERILQFLGWPVTDKVRPVILEHCSFAWMQQHDEKFATRFENGELMFKPKRFIRKGQVGDHKTRLSPEQEQMILEKAKKDLPQDCLDFLGLG